MTPFLCKKASATSTSRMIKHICSSFNGCARDWDQLCATTHSTHQSPHTPALCVLHDDPHSWPIHQTPIIHRHIVRRARPDHQLLQERNLLLDIGDVVIFRVEVNDLECDNVARGYVTRSVDCSVGAFPDDLEFLREHFSSDNIGKGRKGHLV